MEQGDTLDLTRLEEEDREVILRRNALSAASKFRAGQVTGSNKDRWRYCQEDDAG